VRLRPFGPKFEEALELALQELVVPEVELLRPLRGSFLGAFFFPLFGVQSVEHALEA
jgi:hypothetical protein